MYYFKIFGIEKYQMRLSLHDDEELGEKYVNDPELWQKTENILKEALIEGEFNFVEVQGEAAFYGPKIDVNVVDAIGREWQGGTFQLDFLMPERFGLEYIGSDNQPHKAVVIHRTLLGSMERFVGGLIEHYGGAFPTWLAPEQVRILPVSEQWVESAQRLEEMLLKAGVRVSVASRDTLGYRIRESETMKIPFMGVVGEREAGDNTVAVRRRGAGKKQDVIGRSDFISMVLSDIETKNIC